MNQIVDVNWLSQVGALTWSWPNPLKAVTSPSRLGVLSSVVRLAGSSR